MAEKGRKKAKSERESRKAGNTVRCHSEQKENKEKGKRYENKSKDKETEKAITLSVWSHRIGFV